MERLESLSGAIHRRPFWRLLTVFYVVAFVFDSVLCVVYAWFLSLKTRVRVRVVVVYVVFAILYVDIDFIFYYHNK